MRRETGLAALLVEAVALTVTALNDTGSDLASGVGIVIGFVAALGAVERIARVPMALAIRRAEDPGLLLRRARQVEAEPILTR